MAWHYPRPQTLDSIPYLNNDDGKWIVVNDNIKNYQSKWNIFDTNRNLERWNKGDDVILLYGCSFTTSLDVNYSDSLAAKLEQQFDMPVITVGYPGAGNNEIVRQIWNYQEVFEPKVTVVLWSQILRSVDINYQQSSGIEWQVIRTSVFDNPAVADYHTEQSIITAKLLLDKYYVTSSSWTYDTQDILRTHEFLSYTWPIFEFQDRRDSNQLLSADKMHPDGFINSLVAQRIREKYNNDKG